MTHRRRLQLWSPINIFLLASSYLDSTIGSYFKTALKLSPINMVTNPRAAATSGLTEEAQREENTLQFGCRASVLRPQVV